MPRDLKKYLGLSVKEAAEKFGVTGRAVYYWIRGERHPKVRFVFKHIKSAAFYCNSRQKTWVYIISFTLIPRDIDDEMSVKLAEEEEKRSKRFSPAHYRGYTGPVKTSIKEEGVNLVYLWPNYQVIEE